jgi:hypothetical protein
MLQIVVAKRILPAVLISMLGLPPITHAEGALAVGISDGIVAGWVVNHASRDQAYNDALALCRNHPDMPTPSSRCRVVSVFRNQCFALAMNPEWGSSSVGWSTSDDIRVARNDALAKCIAIDGDEDGCEISASACDAPAAPASRPPAKPVPQKKQ